MSDPKSGKRIVDPEAMKRLLLIYDECAACGAPATNAHHIVQKGAPHFGDDVLANLAPICGTGTMGCHGAIHGTPYTHEQHAPTGLGFSPYKIFIERRDAVWVARQIGANLRVENIGYVLDKLGGVAGREFLARAYFVIVA